MKLVTPRVYYISMLKKTAIMLGVSFWPVHLLLINTPSDFLHYIIPAILVWASYLVFRAKPEFYLFPLVLVPIFEPKLAIFPVLACLLDIAFREKKRLKWGTLLVSVAVLAISWRGFVGQTIFKIDNDARQMVIGKGFLYPHPLLARAYQNKARILVDRVNHNFFALTDPSNYFFGFHPRQIVVDNQNLKKYPFVGIVFFALGLLFVSGFKDRNYVVVTAIALLASLSVLTAFDRTDIVLWVPLTLIFLYGLDIVSKSRFAKVVFVLYLFFGVQEFVRMFL